MNTIGGVLACMCVYGIFNTVHFVKINFKKNELQNLPRDPSRAKGRKKKSITAA